MNWKVPLSDVSFNEREVDAVVEVLRSGWLSQGPRVEAFERAFAEALEVPHAVAVANGTAALHLAYTVAGLGPGDEFIIPALTFVATMNAGLCLGAKPVLADCVSPDDLTLSPADVESKITPRTRLIVPMAYGGFCPDMAELVRIAAKHGVAIVEDACHAPLARYEGRRIGTFGLAGCFSFFSNKNLATGEGGAIVTSDPEAAARLRRLRSHGMTTLTWDRHRGHAADYDVLEPGHNYRFDELRAAIGLEQLAKLPALTELRRKAAAKLRLALESLEIDNLEIPFTKVRGDAVHHLFVILLPPSVERAIFRKKMADSGVQTSLHYPLPNRFGMARAYFPPGETRLPVAESVEKRLVTLPMGPHLNDEAIAMIAEAVRESLTE